MQTPGLSQDFRSAFLTAHHCNQLTNLADRPSWVRVLQGCKTVPFSQLPMRIHGWLQTRGSEDTDAATSGPTSGMTTRGHERSVQFRSLAAPCPTLCDPMDRSMPGLPVHHQLLEFTQTWSSQMGQLFASGGQSIAVSASVSVLPVSQEGGRTDVERTGRLWPGRGFVAAVLFLIFWLLWVFLAAHGLCCRTWALSSVEAGAALAAMFGLLSCWSAGSLLPGFGGCGARA